jgi:hypothetical protein
MLLLGAVVRDGQSRVDRWEYTCRSVWMVNTDTRSAGSGIRGTPRRGKTRKARNPASRGTRNPATRGTRGSRAAGRGRPRETAEDRGRPREARGSRETRSTDSVVLRNPATAGAGPGRGRGHGGDDRAPAAWMARPCDRPPRASGRTATPTQDLHRRGAAHERGRSEVVALRQLAVLSSIPTTRLALSSQTADAVSLGASRVYQRGGKRNRSSQLEPHAEPRRPCGTRRSGARGDPSRRLVHRHELAGCRGVLWGLVVAPAAGEAWEPQR